MRDFFAALYEWGGLNPLYATDLGDHLRGLDGTCSDFIWTPWYVNIGWTMLFIVGIFYALQYHMVDSPRFMRRRHWWLVALIIAAFNFVIAFLFPYNSLQTGEYCTQLVFSTTDCLGFGFSNALWSFILFGIISSVPWIRSFSTNCRFTTFWKP
jgi:hypothetical protein